MSAEENTKGYEEGQEVTLEDALDLARGHHGEGNFLLAERTYRDILKAAPNHFPTTHYLGVMLYQMTLHDEALIYLHQAVEAEPEDKQCWNNLGAVYTDLQKGEEAIAAYDKALTIDPAFSEALCNKSLTQYKMGDTEESEKTARAALKIDPDSLEGNINLAITLSTKGNHNDAAIIWEKLSEQHPDLDKIWINWGNTLRSMGRLTESENKCRKAIQLSPDNPEALNNLANALRDKGNPEESLEYYRKATNLRPEYHDAHTNTAIALCDINLYEEAAVSARYAVAFKRDNPQANSALSTALRNLGDFSGARAASLRVINARPDEAEGYIDLADVNFMSDYLDDAHAALNEAIKRSPEAPRSYKKLADLKDKMGDYDGAIEAIEKAISIAPTMPVLWLKKAQIQQMQNKIPQAFETLDKTIKLAPKWYLPYQVKGEMKINVNENEEAEENARKALALNPNAPGPYATLVSLRKITSTEDEIFQKLLSLEKEEKKWGLDGAASLQFALADAYELTKDYSEAFQHLKKGNDTKRQIIPYDPNKAKNFREAIKQRFTSGIVQAFSGTGYESDIPVFIVGMPRSGTTLTEQIISSHPDVFGAGELTNLNSAREQYGYLNSESAKEIGQAYVESIQERDASGKALRITDKMPGNYANIGLIAAALPNAKIIHCGRSAIDTCLSCYKQNFASGQYWSYNLEELADEYNGYQDIMNHWRKVLPGRFLDIRYEDTVGDLEKQARMLIDYIGLPWDEACLEPHKQKRAVLTASKAQVTQPVYKTSVQKWKRYGEALRPLIDNLNIPDEEKAL